MIQGSSVSVRTTARPRNVWCSSRAAAKPPSVVAEADEAVLLRLDEHVAIEAHADRRQDRHEHGGAERHHHREQVEIARQQLPRAPRQERPRQRPREGRFPGHRAYDMFLLRTSANLSRNSRAVSLPTSACWKSGTPSESSLPPQPAWARYGLTIENGNDLMKPASAGSRVNSGRSATLLRAGSRPRPLLYM